jgi:anti-sigma factor RsiW
MTCQMLDQVITPFIDGECTEMQRAAVVAHLRQCVACRHRVEAESSARQTLHAHAAVARTMGVAPAWRPRVFRLGRPVLPMPAPVLLLLAAVTAGALGFWILRPVTLTAVGVIGDSRCQHEHRPAARFAVTERACTLNCVALGAEFVLVTDTQIYRIRNQEHPELAAFADLPVTVKGHLDGDVITVATLTGTQKSEVRSQK